MFEKNGFVRLSRERSWISGYDSICYWNASKGKENNRSHQHPSSSRAVVLLYMLCFLFFYSKLLSGEFDFCVISLGTFIKQFVGEDDDELFRLPDLQWGWYG